MSKFRVNDTFALESRRLFVLAGSIVEGQIQAGMIVNVPLMLGDYQTRRPLAAAQRPTP